MEGTDASSEISFIDPTPTPMPRFSIIGLFDDQKIDPKTRDSRGYSAQDYSTASEECTVEEEDLAIALTGRKIHMLEALSRARHPELYKAQAPKDSPHKATPISPEEARDHVGESVSVRGLVEQISLFEEGYAFLSFSGYSHEIFKGFVPAQSVDHVGGEQFLKSLAGHLIAVTGQDGALYWAPGNRDFLAGADCQRVGSLGRLFLTLRRQPSRPRLWSSMVKCLYFGGGASRNSA